MLQPLLDRARAWRADRRLQAQITRVEAHLAAREAAGPPVLFFNASTRIHRLSLNGAFGLLAAWGLRHSGVPVLQLVCQRGMLQCTLGTQRRDYAAPPPCTRCTRFSRRLFPPDSAIPLTLQAGLLPAWRAELQSLSLQQLVSWQHDGLPLGELCLPTLRWALRRNDLPDDEPVRGLFRQYLLSAASVASRMEDVLDAVRPRRLVLFNGILFPEAVARAAALRRGFPVVTHEVGLRPFSAFFSHEHATFRQVELAHDARLSPQAEERLDAYLQERFRGRFSMAGIRFWPEMRPLPDWLRERTAQHRQTVVVFTNVVFDTSQSHANTLYADMFAWLDDIRGIAAGNPDTLFILRAHPDEDRPGKESQQSVADWVRAKAVLQAHNVAFLGPSDYVSSYELIRIAKLVLVYNSSIGLEAAIAGAPVLCAGRARYSQVPTVLFPPTRQAYVQQLQALLQTPEIRVPPEFRANGRRLLYFELYQASLDFSAFLAPYPGAPGMVLFKPFDPEGLGASPELEVVRRGIADGAPFTLTDA